MAHVVRVWQGQGSAAGVERYCREHFTQTLLPQLRTLDGFVDATILVREIGDATQLVVMTTWASMDAVRRFAGDDLDRAVVEPVVSELLESFDETVTHYTVALAG